MAGSTTVITIPDPAPKAETPSAKPVSLTKRVLIIASPDGFLEVYTDRGVRVHITQRLDVERPEERLADDYLTATLPTAFAEVYRADRLITTSAVRPLTVEQELDRLAELDLLRLIQAAGKEPVNVIVEHQRGCRHGR